MNGSTVESVRNEFDRYRLWYYSAPQYKYDVLIDLMTGYGRSGRLLFMKSEEPIPPNVLVEGWPKLHYSISDLPNMLAILALDKPLFVSLNPSNGIGLVATEAEEIGDLDLT